MPRVTIPFVVRGIVAVLALLAAGCGSTTKLAATRIPPASTATTSITSTTAVAPMPGHKARGHKVHHAARHRPAAATHSTASTTTTHSSPAPTTTHSNPPPTTTHSNPPPTTTHSNPPPTTTHSNPPPTTTTTTSPTACIPQGGGGDADTDNMGGPSDGDGCI